MNRVRANGLATKTTDEYLKKVFAYIKDNAIEHGIAALYADCGACLISNQPGITCLVFTTLFSL